MSDTGKGVDQTAVQRAAIETEFNSKIKELEANRIPDSDLDPAGKTYYKQVDTDRMRNAVKSDTALYNPETESYTRKGREYISTIRQIDDAQEDGFNFVPTKSGEFAVVDNTGKILDSEEASIRGRTPRERKGLSFLKKNNRAHKIVGRLMKTATDSNMFKPDPGFLAANDRQDKYNKSSADISSLVQARDNALKYFDLGRVATPTSSISTVVAAPIGAVQTKEEQKAAELAINIQQSDREATKIAAEAIRRIEFKAKVDTKDKKEPGLNFDFSGSDKETGDWNLQDYSNIAGTAGITIGAISPYSKTGKAALAFGLILDSVNALTDDDRSAWDISSNVATGFSAMMGGQKRVTKKALYNIADNLPIGPKAREGFIKGAANWVTKLLGDKNQVTGKLFRIAGMATLAPALISKANELTNKIRSGEPLTTHDLVRALYLISEVTIITRSMGRRGPKKAVVQGKNRRSQSRGQNINLAPKAKGQPPSAQSPMKPIPFKRKGGEIKKGIIENVFQLYRNGGKLIPKAEDGFYTYNTTDRRAAPASYTSTITDTEPEQVLEVGYMRDKEGQQLYDPNDSVADSDWVLNRSEVQQGKFRFNEYTVPSNWEDYYKHRGSATKSKTTVKIYEDANNPGQFISFEKLSDYIAAQNKMSPGGSGYKDTEEVAPFATSTGLFSGALPYTALTNSIANIASYKNRQTVEHQDGRAPVEVPDLVFAAKSMPFEVVQDLKNQIAASSYDARSLTSDPVANSINARKVRASERTGLNKVRMDEAQWNLSQIQRQEDQEIKARRTLGGYKNAKIDFENSELTKRLANANLNAKIKTQATQDMINNFNDIVNQTFGGIQAKSKSIADAEYQQRTSTYRSIESAIANEYAKDYPNYSKITNLQEQLQEEAGNLDTYERFRQAGSRPGWKRASIHTPATEEDFK